MNQAFKREERYIVTKIKTGKRVTCVVVEEDWPEYELVWKMLQDRMEGKPNSLAEAQARIKVLEDALRYRLAEHDMSVTVESDTDKLRYAHGLLLSTTSPTEALDRVVREAKIDLLDSVKTICDRAETAGLVWVRVCEMIESMRKG